MDTTTPEMEALRFPVGRWHKPAALSPAERAACIATLEAFPARLSARLAQATEAQLDTPYRPEGWTVRQVVHHCADSHLNCLVRIKLALTEDRPTIKPYAEELWAQLPDYRLPIDSALHMLALIHPRICLLLNSLNDQDWAREYVHPQYGTTFSVAQVAALYAWHCDHHFGHVALVVRD